MESLGFRTIEPVILGEASTDDAPTYRYKAIANPKTLDSPLKIDGTLWNAYTQAVNFYKRRNMS